MTETKDKRRANLGKPFEEKLDNLHRWYDNAGLCSVFRTPPPMKIICKIPSTRKAKAGKPSPPEFRCAFVSDGPPDYAAQAEGFAFLFDAKSTEGTRWNFADLPEHQARRFDKHVKQGGPNRTAKAFVLVELGFKQWLLPWADLGPRWWAWFNNAGRAAPGSASVVPSAEPWILYVPDCDWVKVALHHAKQSGGHTA